ncbi:transcription initiation factor TFIID subunit 4-like [Passer domesticus]|uniref:transcription initiation factor TFIID subunit 4-like n=1 Tax=Passer domesticus TaxID=48849 RepID=UPI0030FEC3D2
MKMESSLVSSHKGQPKQELVTPGRVKLVTPGVTTESSLELKKRDPEDGQSSQPWLQTGEPVGLSWRLCPETAEQQSCTAGSTRTLSKDLWEFMDAAFEWTKDQGVTHPTMYGVHLWLLFCILEKREAAGDIIARWPRRAPFPPGSAREKPPKEDEPRVRSPPALPTAEQKFFSAPLEHEQTELPSPPPAPSLGGDGKPAPPLSGPVPPTSPRNSPLPPPRGDAGPPQPAPREAPDPVAPPQPAPREALDPAAPRHPAPREVPKPAAPPAAPPPPADPPVLPGNAINNNGSLAPRPAAVLLSLGAAGAASVPSPSASPPATEFATAQAAPARADPVPSPPPPPVPPLPADPIAVQEHAENGAEPTGPPQEPTPAPVLPAPPTPVVPPVSEAPSLASDPAKSLSFRGGGVARQLTAGAVRLAVFKISVVRGSFRVWLGASPWGLGCLPPPERPSAVGELGPGNSASGPQPRGDGGAEGQKAGAVPFALQEQETQSKASIARLLWGQESLRCGMKIPEKASLPELPVCTGAAGGRKHWVISALKTLAAWSCQVLSTQSPPHRLVLGPLAHFPGPGPPPHPVLGLGTLLSPQGPGPPFCEPGLGSLVHPPGPGPPKGSRDPLLLLFFFWKKKKKLMKKSRKS